MTCCKCIEHKWRDIQEPIFTDGEGKDYCIFHAPEDKKSISVKEFNNKIFYRIKAFNAHSDHDFCNFSGTIFPGTIDFNIFDDEYEMPPLTFHETKFCGEAHFSNIVFTAEVLFINTEFIDRALFIDTKFKSESRFHRIIFHKNAIFMHTEFNEAIFYRSIFKLGADFTESTFNSEADFTSVLFNGDTFFYKTHFKSLSNFMHAEFKTDPVFTDSKFDDKTGFVDSVFYEEASFTGTVFNAESYFIKTVFHKKADFYSVEAKRNALRMHKLKPRSLALLEFESINVDAFSFKGCTWPQKLYAEKAAIKQDNYLVAEELYRSLKQKAAAEHDQPMVSRWHFREKLMYKKRSWFRRYVPLSMTWLYWVSSGFGGKPVRAGLVLLALLMASFALGNLNLPAEGGWATMAESVARWLPLLPLPKYSGQGNALAHLVAVVSQTLILIQAALFAFALRNKFRR